ncbi:MAG: hypothetical protein LBD53_10790 [Tannerella sp.]|nr:hypothetical protein [Tannerella sp.]
MGRHLVAPLFGRGLACLKSDAGKAYVDRADKVEPCPNSGNLVRTACNDMN